MFNRYPHTFAVAFLIVVFAMIPVAANAYPGAYLDDGPVVVTDASLVPDDADFLREGCVVTYSWTVYDENYNGVNYIFEDKRTCRTPGSLRVQPADGLPGSVNISERDARVVSEIATKRFAKTMDQERIFRTVRYCQEVYYVWKCRAVVKNVDTRCTMTIWSWSDKEYYYYELHRLRCEERN